MRTIRDIMQRLPSNGEIRDRLRKFNLLPNTSNKAASVRDLANSLGLDVYVSELPTGMAGRLVQDAFSDSGYAIEVNKSHDVRSQRFTVLHELGHFFFHVDRLDFLAEPMHLNRSADEFYFNLQAEREANDFADVLLFGDGALAAAYTLYRGSVPDIAHYFGVTDRMVDVALRKFGVR